MPHKFKQPCLVCGQLTDGDSRCAVHQEAFRQQRNKRLDSLERSEKKRKRYSSTYHKRAKRLRELARIQPTVCYICKQTIRGDQPVQADHIYPELDDLSPLAPVHARCNQSRGNKPVTDYL